MIIRRDGEYTIFVLERRWPKSDRWHLPSLDFFGTPPGFSASGDTWQMLGVHGVQTLEEGRTALAWMRNKHPKNDWRLTRLTVSQRTEVIEEA